MATSSLPVDRSRLVTECVDGCVLSDQPHDCCAREHWDCDGFGCDDCLDGLAWQVC